MADNVILRLTQANISETAGIQRIAGLIPAIKLAPLIDRETMLAHPKQVKAGALTDAIKDSARTNGEAFPCLTQGLLIGASEYELLDRGRYRLAFNDPAHEGVLDGGHNLLAFGLLMLDDAGIQYPKNMTWAQFKDVWESRRRNIESWRRDVANGTETSPLTGLLVPVELLLPASPDDAQDFTFTLESIAQARAANANTPPRKDNTEWVGKLHRIFEEEDPDTCQRVKWDAKSRGTVSVDRLIALCWTLFRKLPLLDDSRPAMSAPEPATLFRNPRTATTAYIRLMERVRHDAAASAQADLALHHATAWLPELSDCLYSRFAAEYPKADDAGFRKHVRVAEEAKPTPYGIYDSHATVPDGYLAPLVNALGTLIDPETMAWRVEPTRFLKEHLRDVLSEYSLVLEAFNYDPVKVATTPLSYRTAERAFEDALREERRQA